MNEQLERVDGVLLRLEEIDFSPPGLVIDELVGASETTKRLRNDGSHEVGGDELERPLNVVRRPFGVSLLCTFPDRANITCQHIPTVLDTVVRYPPQYRHALAVNMPYAAMPQIRRLGTQSCAGGVANKVHGEGVERPIVPKRFHRQNNAPHLQPRSDRVKHRHNARARRHRNREQALPKTRHHKCGERGPASCVHLHH